MQPPPPLDLEAIREAYKSYTSRALQIGGLEFYKPYLEAINRENPYLGGRGGMVGVYRISEFSLFSREDG